MGSWNEHCGFSTAPIRYGDRVVGVPVVFDLDPDYDSYRSVTSTHYPVGLPVRGSYDSYGGIELDQGEEALLAPLLKQSELLFDKIDEFGVNFLERDYTLRGSGASSRPRPLGETYPDWYKYQEQVIWQDGYYAEGFKPDKLFHVFWFMAREEVYDFLLSRTYDLGYQIVSRDAMDDLYGKVAHMIPLSEDPPTEPIVLEDGSTLELPKTAYSLEEQLLGQRFWHQIPSSHFRIGVENVLNWRPYLLDPPQGFREKIVDLAHVNRVMHELGLSWTPAKTGRQDISYSRSKEFFRFLHRSMVKAEKG